MVKLAIESEKLDKEVVIPAGYNKRIDTQGLSHKTQLKQQTNQHGKKVYAMR